MSDMDVLINKKDDKEDPLALLFTIYENLFNTKYFKALFDLAKDVLNLFLILLLFILFIIFCFAVSLIYSIMLDNDKSS